MLSTDFQFFGPKALPEALALLEEHWDGGKVLAGGMSMVPSMNLGLLRPASVVSLNHVPGLDSVEEDGDVIRIGAMVRHERIRTDPLIARHLPLLSRAASRIGDVQVRHRGTIGGSLAHADPSADYLPIVVVLDATLTLASVSGTRTVAARDFFLDVLLTALEPSELVVEIELPKVPAGAGSGYVRFARVEGNFAIVNAAAIVDDARCTVAIGGAVAPPARVEIPLVDGANDLVESAGAAAYTACADAFGDLSASAEYRRSLTRVLARQAVAEALLERDPRRAPESESPR